MCDDVWAMSCLYCYCYNHPYYYYHHRNLSVLTCCYFSGDGGGGGGFFRGGGGGGGVCRISADEDAEERGETIWRVSIFGVRGVTMRRKR